MAKAPTRLTFRDAPADPVRLQLDLGTGLGLNKPEGWLGVDLIKTPAVGLLHDLRKPWPWKAQTVDAIQAHYLLQYFTGPQRVFFANEAGRVLKPGGTLAITVPHWCASKAYGDVLVQWPPVAEAWFMCLNASWRAAQNQRDRLGYTCDFDFTLGYGLHPGIVSRNIEYQQHAITFWKEAAQDLCATLTKR